MTSGLQTIATLFSGGGGFEVGAMAAGLLPVWGVEINPDIAGVYRQNIGADVIVGPAESVDYSKLPRPYWLHKSPVCKNASVAKTDGEEAAEDLAMAGACARAIRQCGAPQVSLENVWGYRNFESFRIILRALDESGYAFNYWHLNCADYGVPQTRKRLILLASKTHRPRRPKATHTQTPQSAGLFGETSLPRWIGWYAAIEDLIPTLPESKFAKWQMDRLPELYKSYLVTEQYGSDNSNPERAPVHIGTDTPAPVVLASKASQMRAFIVDGKPSNYEGGELAIFDVDDPVNTLTASQMKHPLRAFIATVQGEASDYREADEPAPVITTAHGAAKYRAFIVGAHQSEQKEPTVPVRDGDEPAMAVSTHSPGHVRAFVVEPTAAGADNKFTMPVRADTEPIFTVRSGNKPRAWLSHGKVVSMTPRALARFQSIPDEYELPTKAGLACEVIGNMVPPLAAQRFVESERSAT